MNEFKREERYLVLKIKDVHDSELNSVAINELYRIADKVEQDRKVRGKKPFECVVVESDWPEFEPTWKAIEARMNGHAHATVPSEADMIKAFADAEAMERGTMRWVAGVRALRNLCLTQAQQPVAPIGVELAGGRDLIVREIDEYLHSNDVEYMNPKLSNDGRGSRAHQMEIAEGIVDVIMRLSPPQDAGKVKP